MTDDLDQLSDVAPPPPQKWLQPNNWEELHERIGFELPESFRQLADRYGSGWFGGSFSLKVPGTRVPQADLATFIEDHANFRADDRKQLGERWRLPFPVEPVPGGLVAWSQTMPEVRCLGAYMQRRDGEQHWPVVLLEEALVPRWQVLDLDPTGFLLAMMRGELDVPFTRSKLPLKPGFAPQQDDLDRPKRGILGRLGRR